MLRALALFLAWAAVCAVAFFFYLSVLCWVLAPSLNNVVQYRLWLYEVERSGGTSQLERLNRR